MKKRLFKMMLLVTGMLLGVNVAWADELPIVSSQSAYVDKANSGIVYNGTSVEQLQLFFVQLRDWEGAGANRGTANFRNAASKMPLYKFSLASLKALQGTVTGIKLVVTGNSSESKAVSAVRAVGYNEEWDASTITFGNLVNNGANETLPGTVSGGGSFQPLDDITEKVFEAASTVLEFNAITYVNSALAANKDDVSFAVISNLGRLAYLNTSATLVVSYTTAAVYTATFTESNGLTPTVTIYTDEARTTTIGINELSASTTYYYTAKLAGYEDYNGSFTVNGSDPEVTFTMTAKAPVASLKVNYMLGTKVVATLDGAFEGLYVGEEANIPYRMYVQKDGNLYQAAPQTSGAYFAKTVELTENTVVEIPVSLVDLKGGRVAFFADLDDTDGENAGVRASYCSAYNNKAFTSEEDLAAGTYTFIVRAMNKGRGSSIAVGETTVCGIADVFATNNNWADKTFENVEIATAGKLALVKGGNNTYDCYDVIIAIKHFKAEEPILTFKGKVDEDATLTFGVYDSEDTYGVDFGDGNIQIAKVGINNAGPLKDDGNTAGATTFTGKVAGDGTIKVYGLNDVWYLVAENGVMPTAFDQTKLMNVVQMSISGADVDSVALPAYEKMTHFTFTNSPVKSVDVSKVVSLTSLSVFNSTLSAFEPQLTSIDVSTNVNLETIIVGGNTYKKGELTALDFTNNTKLTQISAENNKIASVTGIPVSVKNIYLSNNELTSLVFPEFTSKGTIQIQKNKFTLATLPAKPAITTTSKYTYAPQPAYEVASIVPVNAELDLSSQLTATGILTEPVTTTYSFVTIKGVALKEGTDYEVVAPGKFKFIKEQADTIHGVMATDAFPKFVNANAYVTTDFVVSAPILTFKGTVGDDVNLTFGVYDTEDTYAVDFGDGALQIEKVGIENNGPVKEDGTPGGATKFSGKVAGDGTIKVYGNNDVWYLITDNGVMPTTFDQPKLMNVVQMNIGNAKVDKLELPAYEHLTQFQFNNATVNTVDVSRVAGLETLRMDYTNLSTIDLSKNLALKSFSAMGKNNAPGNFTSVDLSNNTKLEAVYLSYNQLTEVKLVSDSISALNVQNNKLKTLDLSKVKIIRDLYVSDNELTAIDLSMLTSKSSTMPTVNVFNNQLTELNVPVNVKALQAQNNKIATLNINDVKSTLKIQENALTFATLPAKPASLKETSFKYYAPQAPLAVDEKLTELDLSAQLTAQGILEAPATTTFTFVAGTDTLKADTDYEVVAPGKFKFLKSQEAKVHAVMANEAFPLFTGVNAFVTTEFTVEVVVDGIRQINAADGTGKIYNLQGVEVKQPQKGLNIINGKKIVRK